MPESNALIGIDWGTHSSKWTWKLSKPDSNDIVEGPFKILRSEVRLDNHNMVYIGDEPPSQGTVYVSSIKGKLIANPDAPFWVGPQKRIKLTLGELASFSLWSLLSEAYDNLYRKVKKCPDKIEVRFSLPNWVDAQEGAVGRACYEQAAKVACHLFESNREAWSQSSRPALDEWHRKVQEALNVLGLSDNSGIDDSAYGFRSMLKRVIEAGPTISFRFVAESSAAGLAGLRRSGVRDSGFLKKILAIDVGAGSTDIGYVLRSVVRRESEPKEFLCQLPPANTCPIAGDDLTRRIVEIYWSQGVDISRDEAERRKISGEAMEWKKHPSLNEWIQAIADHVRAYVVRIQDLRWLPEEPGLLVLVTGGSGVVPGLSEKILAEVEQGLIQRGILGSVLADTHLMSLPLRGPAAKDANRLAVVLGAASEDLPKLSYYQKLDPPMDHPTVHIPPSWTGR